ncbi:DUF1365 domain-containing protein [Neiella marina]|uniref:DUF1365 domain-containing protein n=1 Tax=Neiella holothuriorum TaxID=2870530 RepID=A0ABS7EI63_9GAMM|nr:DUF1365 domain-containing protein [Neiella holothuriorum]MBW8191924.1 DUF1365 domain-containing protein [Neiella holothuriorum]
MNSSLYQGVVRHRRTRPKQNSFCYPMFMLAIDLDELSELHQSMRWFSVDSFNWAQLKQADYFPAKGNMGIKQAAVETLKELTGYECDGRIVMVGQLRYLGIYFSPINCFYCYDASGTLRYLLAEVSNTPWLQKHYYAVNCRNEEYQQRKSFHVSPFMDLAMTYHWRIKEPASKLNLHIENHDEQGKLFDATLAMIQQPLNSRNLTRALIKTPIMTVSVVVKIYWQALKLWLKGVPYVPHKMDNRS